MRVCCVCNVQEPTTFKNLLEMIVGKIRLPVPYKSIDPMFSTPSPYTKESIRYFKYFVRNRSIILLKMMEQLQQVTVHAWLGKIFSSSRIV